MNKTFEQLIEREYQLERSDICLACREYCWLHNPFIWCKKLDYSQEVNNSEINRNLILVFPQLLDTLNNDKLKGDKTK